MINCLFSLKCDNVVYWRFREEGGERNCSKVYNIKKI